MYEPDATAIVALLPSDQGGRAGATSAPAFGCVLMAHGKNFDVRLLLGRPLSPGETRRVGVTFLDPGSALAALQPGTVFSLWEGAEIGLGRVETVRATGPLAAE